MYESKFEISSEKKGTDEEQSIQLNRASSSFFFGSASRYHRTPSQGLDLFEAIKKDDIALIRQLYLRHQINVLGMVNQQGENGLIVAVRAYAYAAMKYLLSENIAIDMRDHLGNSALHWAASNNDLQAVELLLANNASRNCKNNCGHTPNTLANSMGYTDIVSRFKEVSNYNYHAEKLTLHQNIIEDLTDGKDFISFTWR